MAERQQTENRYLFSIATLHLFVLKLN